MTFYWTGKFIIIFTTARPLSLPWDRWIQSTFFPPISLISVLILSSFLRLGLPSRLLPLGSSTKNSVYVSVPSHECHSTYPSYLWFDYGELKSWNSWLYSFLHLPVTPSLSDPNILISTLLSNTLSRCSTLIWETNFYAYKITGKIIAFMVRKDWKAKFLLQLKVCLFHICVVI